MRKLTNEELIARQKDIHKNKRLPFTVVLNNIRSLYNVGSIFRTADGVGVEKIYLCGITGTPPNPQITKTALGAEETVIFEHCWDVIHVIQLLKAQGYTIVLLEQLDKSIPYQEYEPKGPVCLVIGNEIEGVSEELISYCDAALEIEMDGIKNSLNVAVAFGVISYHLRHCLKKTAISI